MAKKYVIEIDAEVSGQQDLNALTKSLDGVSDSAEEAQQSLDDLGKTSISDGSAKKFGDDLEDAGKKSKKAFDNIKKDAIGASTGVETLENRAAGAATSIGSATQTGQAGFVGIKGAAEGAAKSQCRSIYLLHGIDHLRIRELL